MADALGVLEKRVKQMQDEINKLRARTDLSVVKQQIRELESATRLMHIGLLETLKNMIVELNAEGVKRYQGAVNAVNTHTTNEVERLLLNRQRE